MLPVPVHQHLAHCPNDECNIDCGGRSQWDGPMKSTAVAAVIVHS
jgi:hypothetical protein